MGVPRGSAGVPPGVPRWRVEKAVLHFIGFCSISHMGQGGSASQMSTFVEPPFLAEQPPFKIKKGEIGIPGPPRREGGSLTPSPGSNMFVLSRILRWHVLVGWQCVALVGSLRGVTTSPSHAVGHPLPTAPPHSTRTTSPHPQSVKSAEKGAAGMAGTFSPDLSPTGRG